MKNKSLETILNLSIKSIFTSDKFFVKLIFIVSLNPSNLTPGFIPRPEWIVVPSIFTADMSVGFKKRIRSSSGSLEWWSNSFGTSWYIVLNKWEFPMPPLPNKNKWTALIWKFLLKKHSLHSFLSTAVAH